MYLHYTCKFKKTVNKHVVKYKQWQHTPNQKNQSFGY